MRPGFVVKLGNEDGETARITVVGLPGDDGFSELRCLKEIGEKKFADFSTNEVDATDTIIEFKNIKLK